MKSGKLVIVMAIHLFSVLPDRAEWRDVVLPINNVKEEKGCTNFINVKTQTNLREWTNFGFCSSKVNCFL